jgi:hypothetical protein
MKEKIIEILEGLRQMLANDDFYEELVETIDELKHVQNPEPNVEFYSKDFPKTFNDFLNLSREFTEGEIALAEKEGLIQLCVALKRKELQYYIERNEALNEIDELREKLDSRDKTSKITEQEHKETQNMQKLLLAEDVFDELEKGKKTTFRLGRRDIQLGELLFESTETKRQTIVNVQSVHYCKLSNVYVEDLYNDGFKDYNDMWGQMKRFYPNMTFDDEVTTIKFNRAIKL